MSIYSNPVTLGPRWMTAKKVSILPYQNLHGYDHPWLAGGGKNLFDYNSADFKNGYFLDSSGTEQSNAYYSYTQNYIDILPSTTYCLQANNSQGQIACTVCIYDSNKTFLERVTAYPAAAGTGTKSGSFTTPASARYIRFSLFRFASDIMLELGSSASPYEPYSNICPISGWEDCRIWVSPTPNPADGPTYQTLFGNPPGTVYGGELDLETGVLTVTMAREIFDGTETWILTTNNRYYCKCDALIKLLDYQGKISCDKLPTSVNSSGLISDNNGITGYSDRNQTYPGENWIYVKVDGVTTLSDYLAWLSANTLTVVYELATPVTYQLTPQQISFLHNQYFGANCGPVLIKVGK